MVFLLFFIVAYIYNTSIIQLESILAANVQGCLLEVLRTDAT